MNKVEASGAAASEKRRRGRRKDDQTADGGTGRERRRTAPQTQAAAQSVIMAHFMASVPAVTPATPQQAAAGYAAAKPRRTAQEIRHEAFLQEAELAHQAAQKAWVFERRKRKKPRATRVEDAVIL
jgi:hypothetical protein